MAALEAARPSRHARCHGRSLSERVGKVGRDRGARDRGEAIGEQRGPSMQRIKGACGAGCRWRASPGDTAACQADEERRPGARWLHWRGHFLMPLARLLPHATGEAIASGHWRSLRQQGRAVDRGQEGLPERSSTVWPSYERTATHARYVNISACVTWLLGEELCVPGRKGNSGRRAAGAPASRGLI